MAAQTCWIYTKQKHETNRPNAQAVTQKHNKEKQIVWVLGLD